MTELINIGCSHRAGHVLTHLYNHQESHIPYKKGQPSKYDNKVFLYQTKINGKTNYCPRAMIFDARNGFGALSAYEYAEKVSPEVYDSYEVVHTGRRVEKNDYQKALDRGFNKSHLLSTENTKYWSDYNKLIYKPQALVAVDDWEIHDGEVVNRFTPTVKFNRFEAGKEAFKKVQEDVTETFRKLLEESDFFQGLQFTTESDNSWGGFTNDLVLSLRDEFFNYSSNSKFNIWTFSLLSEKPDTLSRIRSFVELSRNTSLLIPLRVPPVLSTPSFWQESSYFATVINSLWELLNTNKLSMATFESDLLTADFNRNIINTVALHEKSDPHFEDVYNFGLNADSKYQFSSAFIKNKLDKKDNDPKTTYYSDNELADITKGDTFPHTKSFGSYTMEYSIDSTFKLDIKNYTNYVKKVRQLDDKEELIDDLQNLRALYRSTPDYESDEESDDDY